MLKFRQRKNLFCIFEAVVCLIVLCVFNEADEAISFHTVNEYYAPFVWFHAGYVNVFYNLADFSFFCLGVDF
jgi:hypothetical protein